MLPFGMSLGAGNHLFHHHASSAMQSKQQQRQHAQHLRRLTIAAAAASAGVAGVQLHRQGKLPLPSLPVRISTAGARSQQQPLVQIPRELAEVICGAIGEIVQVAVLYPLDTIKVRCQAGGLPLGAAVQQLAASGGNAAGMLRLLYAGVFSASLSSVAVGSLYYFTFCAAKRAATAMVADAEAKSAKATSGPAAAAASLLAPAAASQDSLASTPHHFPHCSGVDYHGFDPVFAAICSDEKAAAAAAAAAADAPQQAGSKTPAGTDITSSSSSKPAAPAELSSNGKLQANILAACAAAVVGALVEAPVELFKHRAQAGQTQGNMLGHIFHALRHQGPGALYGSFFVPFLFKSLPFDIGELMTYSSLNDWRSAQLAKAPAAMPAGTVADSSAQAFAALPTAAAAASEPDVCLQEQAKQQSMTALGSITAAHLGRDDSSSSGSSSVVQPGQVLSNMPDHVWDMAVGAAAGAAAVLVSMPPDCIKTVMETGGGVAAAPGGGPMRSAAAFFDTGKQLVQQHGSKGLFIGLAPRLLESVPSTMLYWLTVEGCRRVLEPYVAKEAIAGTASSTA